MTERLTIDSTATRWSTDERAGKPLLVLLHGYGADEHDLFGLVPYLPAGIAVAALPAPLKPPFPAPGRSWFPLETLGRSAEAVNPAAQAVLDWLDENAAESSSVALLGFSQGATVSLQAMRMAPRRFDAVLVLSSIVSPGELPGDEVLKEVKPPVFWGMGTQDHIFTPPTLGATAEWLPAHSTMTSKVYDGMGHGISQEELADVREFLDAWVVRVTKNA